MIDKQLLRALEQAVVASPEETPLRLHLAELLADDGQVAAALGHCERILRDQPENEQASALASRLRDRLAPRSEALRTEKDGAPSASTGAPPSTESAGGGLPNDEELLALVRPEITLDDVAGMQDVKEALALRYLEPLRNDEFREAFGLKVRSGMLLWGPPGCGKTFLARALAGELGVYFLHVGVADILDMWLGNSERNVQALFAEARRMAPTVLFIDEVDALGHTRSSIGARASDGVVQQFLIELDGVAADNDGLLVLAATNQPWSVDPALLRPGRLDQRLLVPPPDRTARTGILQRVLADRPTEALDLSEIARLMDGFSGADVAGVATSALQYAMRESATRGEVRPVTQDVLVTAVREAVPSIGAWLDVARNHVEFANSDGRYDALLPHLRRR